MLEKLNEKITETSDKIMTNEKVEGFINNLGGILCFVGAVTFGILFIVCGASLMKTGKNYVVRPSAEAEEEEEEEEEASESTTTEESATTEEAATEEAGTSESGEE
jgi:flagellar biosynthesis component FlhA